MHINNLPQEILKLVFEKLAEPRRPSHDDIVTHNPIYNLRKARRVCRLWNLIITPHLYSTISLKHKQGGGWRDQEFESWNRIIDLPIAKKAARCVIINTAPSDRYRDIDDEQWNQGTFPAFTSAMDRLIELPNITSLCIRFHESCLGRRRNGNGEIDDDDDEAFIDLDEAGGFKEMPGTRRRFLEAVFAAINKRATNLQNSTISSLTIFNLQNLVSQDLCVSQLSRNVMRNIAKLHLYIIEETLWEGDHFEVDLYRPERYTYEPFLQTAILPVLSSQLTYLNLRFRQHWGTAPGYFDGRDLMLPHLRTLILGNFVISHRHHLDWVLAQTGLRRLRFEDCRILRNFTVRDESANTWGLRTHDWLFAPNTVDGRKNPGDDNVSYIYPGTWDQVFQDIKQSLSCLVDMQVQLF
ncbi:uncharacterized protein B0J16DRAFT_328930 [Fusarium flagelliforme]|uniref:uncharacterized protein n=1 Tax=Fusarium flagelliforme TaxID=2675880 RepID=UPI001E8CB750|nr:uncharacterized protein B0J16DRAFT_328930 [Fusarium flagelliforme]KAH7197705.1 hypothetical protein B0J16DRAFT_328930 [Fusarium flagelliforme]